MLKTKCCAAAGALAGWLGPGMDTPAADAWSVDDLHGPTIPFAITLDEATWISLDVSPDGRTLVFDILGDLYTLPIGGGDATRITQEPAYDAQPRFSPDGRSIAFVSDRDGSSNLWIVEPDGARAKAVTRTKNVAFLSPEWMPDGRSLLASIASDSDLKEGGAHELHAFPIDGGASVRLLDSQKTPTGAVASPDGRRIYFNNSAGQYATIERLERATGETHSLVGGYRGVVRPTPSPDGRLLAFGRRFDDGERMLLRDLESGTERELDLALDLDQQIHPATDIEKLPGFAFTPDGRAIIYSAHGKIRRYDLAKNVSTVIPFRAQFAQQIHRPLRVQSRLDDGPVHAKMLRWSHESADGRSVFFSAAGKNYRYDVSSKAVEAVGDGPGLEYAPAVSPDGRWLAYVGWSDAEGGHLYKVALPGGAPVRLTEQPGHYEHPSWSADGSKLVFLQSSGGELRGEANLEESFAKSVRWIATAGRGATHLVTTVKPRGDRRQEMRPMFNATASRVYFGETPVRRQPTYLSSIGVDGSDKRRHAKFDFAEDLLPSPDGKWLAFTEHFEAYVMPMPSADDEPAHVSLAKRPAGVVRLSDEGAYFLNWTHDGRALTWGWGPDFYRVSLDEVRRRGEEAKPASTTITVTTPRAAAKGSLLFRGARIVTMGRGGVIERGDLLVENRRIKAIGRAGELSAPAGAKVIDASGKTLIPGLIDIHMHYRPSFDTEIFPQNDWGYAIHLAYGVTTVRNPSARAQAIFTQGEMIEAGTTLGPRIFSTGEPLYFMATPFGRPVTDLDDARLQVRRLKRLGATSVKQYTLPRREQRQWIVQAAREEGVPVVGEGAWKLYHNLTIVMDGHTTLEHAFKVERVYKDIRALLAASQIHYTPTLFVAHDGSAEDYFYQTSDVFRDAKLLRFMPNERLAAKARVRGMRPEDDFYFKLLARSTAEIVRDGGKVAYGAHGNLLGLGAHWELWATAMGGLSPFDTLRTATINSAEALGLEVDLGSLDAGKIADLVVLNADPLQDIRNSNSVLYVMKDGVLWHGDTLDRVWPNPEKFQGFYWQRKRP